MPQFEQPSSITPTQAESGMPSPKTNFRWTICALLFFGTAINYIDRQILGILKPTLSHDLGWSDTGYSNIVAAFQLAYAMGYLFGGRLMDTIGVKRGYTIIATVWSIAAAAHGLVRSVLGFTLARATLGIAEGGNFPAAIRTVSDWFPQKERALATGIFNSASNVGALFCPLTVPILAVKFGWPMAFFITGALGILWVIAWALFYDSPDMHKSMSPGERQYIESGRTAADEVNVPWLLLLQSKAVWAYMLANIFATPVWWFYLFWIPDVLSKQFHLGQIAVGQYTAVIYGIAIVGSVAGGWLAARLLAAGCGLNAARKTAMLVPALLVVPVFFSPFQHNVWALVMLVGVAAGAHQAWSANLFTLVSDTMPKRVIGSVVGLGGFAGGIMAMFNALATGRILDAFHTYIPMFAYCASAYLLSLLIIHLLIPRIEKDTKLMRLVGVSAG